MILVTGANGVVGSPLCKMLDEDGLEYLFVSRNKRSDIKNAKKLIQWDLENNTDSSNILNKIQGVTTVIHCAPIWFLPSNLQLFKDSGVSRIIAFSSTSVTSKANSLNQKEMSLVSKLQNSEIELQNFCDQNGINLTIFRPSMIYGYGRDQNIMQIAKIINRFGFFVIAGSGKGLRQPVHASDLAKACINIIEKPKSYSKVYELAGAEVLTYQDLVRRIFKGLGKKERVFTIPVFMVRSLLKIAEFFTRFGYTPDMAERMNQDLIYDYKKATQDFKFTPQNFLSNPDIDLP